MITWNEKETNLKLNSLPNLNFLWIHLSIFKKVKRNFETRHHFVKFIQTDIYVLSFKKVSQIVRHKFMIFK